MSSIKNKKLASTRLTRAEYIDIEERIRWGLPDRGLVVIEVWNHPDCKEPIVRMVYVEKGISHYMRTLGDFKDVKTQNQTHQIARGVENNDDNFR